MRPSDATTLLPTDDKSPPDKSRPVDQYNIYMHVNVAMNIMCLVYFIFTHKLLLDKITLYNSTSIVYLTIATRILPCVCPTHQQCVLTWYPSIYSDMITAGKVLVGGKSCNAV